MPSACVEDVRVHGPGAVGVPLDEPFQVPDLVPDTRVPDTRQPWSGHAATLVVSRTVPAAL
jgi:hypothetical protein